MKSRMLSTLQDINALQTVSTQQIVSTLRAISPVSFSPALLASVLMSVVLVGCGDAETTINEKASVTPEDDHDHDHDHAKPTARKK